MIIKSFIISYGARTGCRKYIRCGKDRAVIGSFRFLAGSRGFS